MMHPNRQLTEIVDDEEHGLSEPLRLYKQLCPFIYALTTIALSFGIYTVYANSERYLIGLVASILIFFFASKIFTYKLKFNRPELTDNNKR